MRVTPSALPEVLVIDPQVMGDNRGFFLETFHVARYAEHGIRTPFVQDNHSRSVRNTVRGLHLQIARPQAKLIRVVFGEIFDVAVDVRVGSPTFGKWVGVHLSAENRRQCYIPEGFAHGFSVVSDGAEVEYKCTDYFEPSGQLGIAWNDETFGIPWGTTDPVLSERDRANPTVHDVLDQLPRYGSTKP